MSFPNQVFVSQYLNLAAIIEPNGRHRLVPGASAADACQRAAEHLAKLKQAGIPKQAVQN